ncbi:MAG: sugar ABC transporter substrate-binding protein [Acidobacteria bacterium]|nr:sugar ABC transporter substrate-binding protein [Acidobacteriota bacterium]MCA1652240.1 sugar ABC transporter substrate-binding protein [Acidobacteriota bacterium]
MLPKCAVFLAIVVAAGLAACNRGEPAGDARPRVALVLKTLNSPFFIEMQRGAEEAARQLNIDLVVQAAEREVDVEKQMQIIENLIQAKVNALAVTPSGSREVVPALVKANQAGIPVIVVDTRLDPKAAADAGVKTVAFVGSDNYRGGQIVGEFLVKASGGRANVAILEGIPGHDTGDSRVRGFREAIKATPGVKIVASQTANWERDQGFSVFQNILQAHPELDTVFACNDMMALGAIEAISAAGRTGRIRVLGFDAVEDARRALETGTMIASVAQFPQEMGRIAVESAVKVLKGETVPTDISVSIGLVTKENARK